MNHPICLGITGASGAIYALRLLEVLREAGREVHLSISQSGRDVIQQELSVCLDLERFDAESLIFDSAGDANNRVGALLQNPTGTSSSGQNEYGRGRSHLGQLKYFHCQDFTAPMASGSFLTGGMVICPCSGTTLSAVAAGSAGNLIQRAAEVHLKERRKLILVPRETPLSLAHIDNMRRVTEAGAVVLPASPGWYHGVNSICDLVDFVVARICDQLGVKHALTQRWGETK
jgi:4-hydroxy-3-polyprenylbenzoate decarboxylase